MKLGDLSQGLSAVSFSKFSTFSKFKNIKEKAYSEYESPQLKGFITITRTCQNCTESVRDEVNC